MTYEYNQHFHFLQCPHYTTLHTPASTEADIASPQQTNHNAQSPAATEVNTAPPPWPEEEAPTGFPEDQAVQQQSHQQSVQSKKTAPTTWEQRQDAGEAHEHHPDQMNILYKHFHNNWNITK